MLCCSKGGLLTSIGFFMDWWLSAVIISRTAQPRWQVAFVPITQPFHLSLLSWQMVSVTLLTWNQCWVHINIVPQAIDCDLNTLRWALIHSPPISWSYFWHTSLAFNKHFVTSQMTEQRILLWHWSIWGQETSHQRASMSQHPITQSTTMSTYKRV